MILKLILICVVMLWLIYLLTAAFLDKYLKCPYCRNKFRLDDMHRYTIRTLNDSNMEGFTMHRYRCPHCDRELDANGKKPNEL